MPTGDGLHRVHVFRLAKDPDMMCFFVFVVLVWFEFIFARRVRIPFASNRQVYARSGKSENMRTTHAFAERTISCTAFQEART